MKDDPEAAAELGAGQQAQPVAQEPAMDPAAAAPMAPAPAAPEQPVAEGVGDVIIDAIEAVRMAKPGLKQQDFLDELYMYIENQYGQRAAEMMSNAGQDEYDEWYDSYLDTPGQGVPKEGEDMANDESKPEDHRPSMKEIVEFIKPFYNKHAAEQGLGEWRKGPTELGIMAGKQFGDHVGKLVEKYVEEMQAKTEAMRSQQEATMQFEAIKKLAGLSKI
jgi:hypothetical protein